MPVCQGIRVKDAGEGVEEEAHMCAEELPGADRGRIQLLLEVARLYHIQGMNQAAIAKEVGYSQPTSRSRKDKAMA